MARPFNHGVPNQREAARARFAGSWWRVVVGALFLVTIFCAVFLLHQNGHLLLTSLVTSEGCNTTLVNASPDKAGTMNTGGTSNLGQERHWVALYKDLQKARNGVKNYFHSQVLMRVQHRLPMDNGTLYNQLQSMKAEALYRFRSQIGDKDVTGHVWDELEVDTEKTIMDLLHLNLMIAKENNMKDRQVAAAIKESDCDNIYVSEVKVVCLQRRMKMLQSHVKQERKKRKCSKESDQGKQQKEMEIKLEQRQRTHREEQTTKNLPAPLLNDLPIFVLGVLLLSIVLFACRKGIWEASLSVLFTLGQLFLHVLATLIGLEIFYSQVTPGTESLLTKFTFWIEKKAECWRRYLSDWYIIQRADLPSPSSCPHGRIPTADPKADLLSSDPDSHGFLTAALPSHDSNASPKADLSLSESDGSPKSDLPSYDPYVSLKADLPSYDPDDSDSDGSSEADLPSSNSGASPKSDLPSYDPYGSPKADLSSTDSDGSPKADLPSYDPYGSPNADLSSTDSDGSPKADLSSTDSDGSPKADLSSTDSDGSSKADLPSYDPYGSDSDGSPKSDLPSYDPYGSPKADLPSSDSDESPKADLPSSDSDGSPKADLPSYDPYGSPKADLPSYDPYGSDSDGSPKADLPLYDPDGSDSDGSSEADLRSSDSGAFPKSDIPSYDPYGSPKADLSSTDPHGSPKADFPSPYIWPPSVNVDHGKILIDICPSTDPHGSPNSDLPSSDPHDFPKADLSFSNPHDSAKADLHTTDSLPFPTKYFLSDFDNQCGLEYRHRCPSCPMITSTHTPCIDHESPDHPVCGSPKVDLPNYDSLIAGLISRLHVTGSSPLGYNPFAGVQEPHSWRSEMNCNRISFGDLVLPPTPGMCPAPPLSLNLLG